jgi:hypothetical protein
MQFLIVLFALLAASPPTVAQNPRDIVVRSIKADHDTAEIAAQYTYQQRDVVKELDSSDRVKKTTIELHEIMFLGGQRYERLIGKDDKPLPPSVARKEHARID